MAFVIFISFLVLQRLTELFISKKNEKWLVSRGAVEYGAAHYPFIVALHTAFIASLIVEYWWKDGGAEFNVLLSVLFFLLIGLKVWVIVSLGSYWNTKIYRIPHTVLIKKGPYRFLKHPNYLIVIAEITVIPLLFDLYYTAVIFSVLNAVMLTVRTREENKALAL